MFLLRAQVSCCRSWFKSLRCWNNCFMFPRLLSTCHSFLLCLSSWEVPLHPEHGPRTYPCRRCEWSLAVYTGSFNTCPLWFSWGRMTWSEKRMRDCTSAIRRGFDPRGHFEAFLKQDSIKEHIQFNTLIASLITSIFRYMVCELISYSAQMFGQPVGDIKGIFSFFTICSWALSS